MAPTWESDLARLLDRLSAAQRELLALLAAKRELIIRRDMAALAALALQDQTALARAHARAESVRARSLALLRLVGPLHDEARW